jgi:magnesium-transporting ATPase (P-type)
VAENWQSEYLQFLLFVLLTVFLFQRGSTESKPLHKGGRESDKDQKVAEYAGPDSPMWSRQRGWRLSLYSHSLGLTMGLIFLLSWLAQFVAGRSAYNAEQLQERSDPLGWIDYALAPDFWNRTLQNWQSEFLAVGSMVVLSIYLRERGSPESKPVGEPHEATGGEG